MSNVFVNVTVTLNIFNCVLKVVSSVIENDTFVGFEGNRKVSENKVENSFNFYIFVQIAKLCEYITKILIFVK